MRKLLSFSLVALLGVAATACEEQPTEPESSQAAQVEPRIDAPLSGASVMTTTEARQMQMMNSNAPFKTWHQGFNHGTDGWITDDRPGPTGWCGDITQMSRGEGPVMPSAGRGYATVEWGACNDFFQNVIGIQEGAPYSPGGGYSSTWPSSGFVYELDVYLDPEMDGGTEFTLAGNVCDRSATPGEECVVPPFAFHYFAAVVASSGSSLIVTTAEPGADNHAVSEPGWYTLRYVLGSDRGDLSVEFQLTQDGRELFSESIEKTLAGADVSSFQVADLGSGYLWFVTVPEGLELPIDEHRVRHGR